MKNYRKPFSNQLPQLQPLLCRLFLRLIQRFNPCLLQINYQILLLNLILLHLPYSFEILKKHQRHLLDLLLSLIHYDPFCFLHHHYRLIPTIYFSFLQPLLFFSLIQEAKRFLLLYALLILISYCIAYHELLRRPKNQVL